MYVYYKKYYLIKEIIVFCIFALYLPIIYGQKLIRVPKDYSTIQEAINISANGDTVLISPGSYYENINFNGKKITICSEYAFSKDTSIISSTVIQGTVTSNTISFSNSEDSLSILCGITVTGGGTGIYCSNSSPTLNHIIVSNNLIGGGIYCINSNPKIEYSFIIHNVSSYIDRGGGISCMDSNPSITDCKITDNVSNYYGGGIYCLNSNPKITHVEVSENKALSYYGGGIYCENSSPFLSDVLITKNIVYQSIGIGSGGGGICSLTNSNPYISEVTISKNSAEVAGGGIYVDSNSKITFDSLYRCNIYLNDATVGYDLYSYHSFINVIVDTFTVMSPTNDFAWGIGNYTFNILHFKISQLKKVLYVSPSGDNSNSGLTPNTALRTIGFAMAIIDGASDSVATIYLSPGIYSSETNGEHFEITGRSFISLKGSGVNKTFIKGNDQNGIFSFSNITGIKIEDLTVENGGYGLGGAVYCSNSNINLKDIVIKNCNSIEGGAIYNSFGGVVTITNALIYNNHSEQTGGALYGYYANYNLMNVTLVNNSSALHGSGIYCQSTYSNIINSILWNNPKDEIYIYNASTINLAYSVIQDSIAGIIDPNQAGVINWIEGNTKMDDPLFVNQNQGDFHLSSGSRCIGMGCDSIEIENIWYFSPLEDIENNMRPNPKDSKPDLGAYENSLGSPSNNLNQNNDVVVQIKLLQNYPNPFNPSTMIRYELFKRGDVTFTIYDITGRELWTINQADVSVGVHNYELNMASYPSGVYFFRAQENNISKVIKLVLFK